MKIKLSKSQWEMVGTKAGWLKTAKISTNDVIKVADEGTSQTMPLDSVQSSPAAQAKFKKKKKVKKTL